MITVIATGFDGGRRRQTARYEQSQAGTESSGAGRAPRERDFLEELQRQRDETADGGDHSLPRREDDGTAAAGTPRVERSVGEPAPVKRPNSYDADDLEIPSFLRRK
jgi:hypothetical protein